MQANLVEFDRLGAKVVAISFVEPARLKQYLNRRAWSMPVLADPDRKAYQAFGLERARWLQLFRPRAIRVYLKLMLQGKMPQLPREDIHQLGGDFILDANGRIVYEYRSEDPADRPSPSTLLEVLARSAGGSDAK